MELAILKGECRSLADKRRLVCASVVLRIKNRRSDTTRRRQDFHLLRLRSDGSRIIQSQQTQKTCIFLTELHFQII